MFFSTDLMHSYFSKCILIDKGWEKSSIHFTMILIKVTGKDPFQDFTVHCLVPEGNHLLRKNCSLPLSSEDQVILFFKEIRLFSLSFSYHSHTLSRLLFNSSFLCFILGIFIRYFHHRFSKSVLMNQRILSY